MPERAQCAFFDSQGDALGVTARRASGMFWDDAEERASNPCFFMGSATHNLVFDDLDDDEELTQSDLEGEELDEFLHPASTALLNNTRRALLRERYATMPEVQPRWPHTSLPYVIPSTHPAFVTPEKHYTPGADAERATTGAPSFAAANRECLGSSRPAQGREATWRLKNGRYRAADPTVHEAIQATEGSERLRWAFWRFSDFLSHRDEPQARVRLPMSQPVWTTSYSETDLRRASPRTESGKRSRSSSRTHRMPSRSELGNEFPDTVSY